MKLIKKEEKVMVYKLSVDRSLLRTYTITYTFIQPVQQQNLLVVVLVQTVLHFSHCEQIIWSYIIGLHYVKFHSDIDSAVYEKLEATRGKFTAVIDFGVKIRKA